MNSINSINGIRFGYVPQVKSEVQEVEPVTNPVVTETELNGAEALANYNLGMIVHDKNFDIPVVDLADNPNVKDKEWHRYTNINGEQTVNVREFADDGKTHYQALYVINDGKPEIVEKSKVVFLSDDCSGDCMDEYRYDYREKEYTKIERRKDEQTQKYYGKTTIYDENFKLKRVHNYDSEDYT